jgi:hypothetical protein
VTPLTVFSVVKYHSGHSVSSAGDVNGDGLDDLIVGAYTANPSGKSKAGKSYVVFGKQGTDPIELSAIAALNSQSQSLSLCHHYCPIL